MRRRARRFPAPDSPVVQARQQTVLHQPADKPSSDPQCRHPPRRRRAVMSFASCGRAGISAVAIQSDVVAPELFIMGCSLFVLFIPGLSCDKPFWPAMGTVSPGHSGVPAGGTPATDGTTHLFVSLASARSPGHSSCWSPRSPFPLDRTFSASMLLSAAGNCRRRPGSSVHGPLLLRGANARSWL